MPELGKILAANRAYAAAFDAGGRPVRPLRRLAVVACMDSRMDIFAMLGLEIGDAHIIRNAGGLVTDDVVRSLCLSQRALGTEEVILVHHTNCGVEGLSDDDFLAGLEAETGRRPDWVPGGFADVYEDVRQSIRRILDCPFLPHRDAVSGFVFDVTTGLLHRVEP